MKSRWREVTIGKVCSIRPPKQEVRESLSDDDAVSFLPMGDIGIREKYIHVEQTRPLSEVYKGYTYFADGDVLLAKITPCFQNGKLGIARELTNGVGFGSTEFFVLRCSDSIDPEYLFYFLSRESLIVDGVARMGGAVGQQRVPPEFVAEHSIPLPPLTEQKRIVAILDEAFAAIATASANAERNLANAYELFESHLNTVFSQKGEGWTEKPLGDFVVITHGFAFKGPDFETNADESQPIVLTPGNYAEDATLAFNDKNTKRLRTSPPNGYTFGVGELTVVMTDLSSKMKILGKPAFIDRPNVLHNQRIGRVVFKDESLDPRFVFHFLRTRKVSERIKATSTGTMVRHTAPKRIITNIIPLPPDSQDQRTIVAKLDEAEAETQQLESLYTRKLALLTELKQSILHKAFTGELTVDRMPHKEVLEIVAVE